MPDSTAAAKAELRRVAIHARRQLDDPARAAARDAIAARVLERAAQDGWTSVAAFVPLRSEPAATDLLDALAARTRSVIVPHLLPDRDLDWVGWDGTPGEERLGVAAIGEADAVLVPALLVAQDGTRLGRGGGSYDRALARCGPRVPRIALLFDGELVPELPRDDWDQRVSAVAMPSAWVSLE